MMNNIFCKTNNVSDCGHDYIRDAYSELLNDNLKKAEFLFKKTDSPRAHWGISLIQIINGYIERYPSYFEIRNFLEIDLDFLLKNNKNDYVKRVFNSVDLLENINQETYKYCARVLYENKLYDKSLEYLKKSAEVFYNDPELHVLFAKYYLNTGEYNLSNWYLDECIKICPDYFPAKKMKSQILKYLD